MIAEFLPMSLQPNNIHTIATFAQGHPEAFREQLLENSDAVHSEWAFSTSSFLSGTNQIQNPHLPIVFHSTLPSTTLPTSSECNHYFIPPSTQDPFLEAGMLAGAGQLVSLLPSVMQTDSTNSPTSKRKTLPIDARDYLQSVLDENFQSGRDTNNQLTESQRFSISQSTISLQNYSPFPPLSAALVDAVTSPVHTPASTTASIQTDISTPFQLIITHPQQLQNFQAASSVPPTPPCRPSQPPNTATIEKQEEVVDDASPNQKKVTFHPRDHVVEIPSRLTPAELSSQLEQASAEALNEAANAEEKESQAALEAFKERYQFTSELLALTSGGGFSFNFGNASSSEELENVEKRQSSPQ